MVTVAASGQPSAFHRAMVAAFKTLTPRDVKQLSGDMCRALLAWNDSDGEFGGMTDEDAQRVLIYVTKAMFNRGQRVESRLKDIYSAARSFHSTHEEILARLGELYATSDYQKLSPYYRGRFDGIRETLSNNLYHSYLEWRVSFHGRLVLSKDVPEGKWSEVDGNRGAHVWSDRPECVFAGPAKNPEPEESED